MDKKQTKKNGLQSLHQINFEKWQYVGDDLIEYKEYADVRRAMKKKLSLTIIKRK